MPLNTPQARPDPLDIERQRWEATNAIIDKSHPRFPDYHRIAVEADTVLRKAEFLRGQPFGAKGIEDVNNKLKELHEKAIEIRLGMFPGSLRKSLGIPAGADIETELMKEIDPVKETPGQAGIGAELERIAKGLAVDPADLLGASTAQGNIFFFRTGMTVCGNIEVVRAKRKMLADIRAQLPNLSPLISKLEAGLNLVESINPLYAASYKERSDIYHAVEDGKNKMDTRPLKIIGGLGAATLAGVGLLYNVFTRTSPTWPTYMWGGIAVLSIYPDLFKGKAGKELENIALMNAPGTQALLGAFKGTEGVKAFEEAQDIARDPEAMKAWNAALKAGAPVTPSLIGQLTGQTGSTPTAFGSRLLKMQPDQAKAAVSYFARKMSPGEQEVLKAALMSII